MAYLNHYFRLADESRSSQRRGRTHRPNNWHTGTPLKHHQAPGTEWRKIIRSAATGGSTSGENCIGSPGRMIKSVQHGGIRRCRRDSGPPRYDIAVSALSSTRTAFLASPAGSASICARDVESCYALYSYLVY